jgi:hypothetical protein
VAGGKGEMRGYIENVDAVKTAGGLEITVPTSAISKVYSKSTDGKTSYIVNFSNDVAGITNTLVTTPGSVNSIPFGEVVNFAISQFSDRFTGINSLRGKYKVEVTLSGIPLRRADGTELPAVTVSVPTTIDGSGNVTASKVVTGTGLVGYISLVP